MTHEEKVKYCERRGLAFAETPAVREVEAHFKIAASHHRREEAAAWVAFAAADIGAAIIDARSNAGELHGIALGGYMARAVAMVADAMLAEYRARFGAAPTEET